MRAGLKRFVRCRTPSHLAPEVPEDVDPHAPSSVLLWHFVPSLARGLSPPLCALPPRLLVADKVSLVPLHSRFVLLGPQSQLVLDGPCLGGLWRQSLTEARRGLLPPLPLSGLPLPLSQVLCRPAQLLRLLKATLVLLISGIEREGGLVRRDALVVLLEVKVRDGLSGLELRPARLELNPVGSVVQGLSVRSHHSVSGATVAQGLLVPRIGVDCPRVVVDGALVRPELEERVPLLAVLLGASAASLSLPGGRVRAALFESVRAGLSIADVQHAHKAVQVHDRLALNTLAHGLVSSASLLLPSPCSPPPGGRAFSK